jgi:uncharacterized protein (DUF1684 family)
MTTTPTAEQRWVRFRAARDAALAEKHGWLSLTSFQWLPSEPAPVDILPGIWSADQVSAQLSAAAADGVVDLATGHPVDGTVSAALDDEESLAWVACGGEDGQRIVVELARRAGRYAIRTRDSESPTLTGFTGVPVFAYRSDLVVRGRYEAYDEPKDEVIRTAHPEVPGSERTVGEIVFRLPGEDRDFRLRASQEDGGALGITFHDSTNGISTPGWRRVTVRRPETDGAVTIDFNRAVAYPSAFTPFGTCPMPVRANVIDAPVEAGEKLPLVP